MMDVPEIHIVLSTKTMTMKKTTMTTMTVRMKTGYTTMNEMIKRAVNHGPDPKKVVKTRGN